MTTPALDLTSDPAGDWVRGVRTTHRFLTSRSSAWNTFPISVSSYLTDRGRARCGGCCGRSFL